MILFVCHCDLPPHLNIVRIREIYHSHASITYFLQD
jgi:hypothetical protein